MFAVAASLALIAKRPPTAHFEGGAKGETAAARHYPRWPLTPALAFAWGVNVANLAVVLFFIAWVIAREPTAEAEAIYHCVGVPTA
jgi:hypothetical protein